MKLSAISTFLAADVAEKIPALKQVVIASAATSLQQVLETAQLQITQYPAAVLVFGPADAQDEGRPAPTRVDMDGSFLVLGQFSASADESEQSIWGILDQLRQYFMLDLRYYRVIGDNVVASFTGWRPIDLTKEFPGFGAFAVGFTIEDRDEPSESGLIMPPGVGPEIVNAMPEVIPEAGFLITAPDGVLCRVKLLKDDVLDKYYLEIVQP